MQNKVRSGFTLVELLVVISIIAMLAGLLMPAVNRAREAARRTQCMNNMRNVALAMMQYDTAKQKLPGWANLLCPNPRGWFIDSDEGTERHGSSWAFELLPYIEKGDLFYLYGPNNPDESDTSRKCFQNGLPQEHIKLLVCPNDSAAVGAPNALSYVVNCGMRDHKDNWKSLGAGGGAGRGSRYLEPPANGVFHNNWYRGKATSQEPRTANSLAYISGGDGTASTLMVSENVDAFYWHGSKNQSEMQVFEAAVCFCWASNAAGGTTDGAMKINANIGMAGSTPNLPRPSGNHDSGVNVIFCDAHAAFISENIDWMTWCLLHTPSGRQVMQPGDKKYINNNELDPFRYTPLNEKF